jgi:lysophospholipase L1-like esterase
VINRGFGGSELSDVNQFFDRLIGQYQPKQIVIYCGGNDLNSGKSVEQVVADFKTFHARVRTELPKTRLAYISIALNPARWSQRDRVIQANAAIAALLAEDPRSVFLNVVPDMLGPDGQPKPDIFVADKLHMNRKGYELWKPRVEAVLVK